MSPHRRSTHTISLCKYLARVGLISAAAFQFPESICTLVPTLFASPAVTAVARAGCTLGAVGQVCCRHKKARVTAESQSGKREEAVPGWERGSDAVLYGLSNPSFLLAVFDMYHQGARVRFSAGELLSGVLEQRLGLRPTALPTPGECLQLSIASRPLVG